MQTARFIRPAAINTLARQPLISRPLGTSGLGATHNANAKGAPSIQNPLARKPIVSR